MKNPKTAAVLQGMMAQMAAGSPVLMDENDPMMTAMMNFMPLKSLKSFGMMDDEKLAGLLGVLKAAMES